MIRPRTACWMGVAALVLAPLVAVGGELHVTEAAAYTGTYGLQVQITDGTGAWVEDDHPGGTVRYRARVYVNTDALTLPAGGSAPILVAYDGGGQPVTWLELAENGGGVEVLGSSVDGTGTSSAGPVTLPAGWHAVELAWIGGAGDGSLELDLDGVTAATVANLDTGGVLVSSVRLGAPDGVPGGATGSLVFDCFDSSPYAALGLAGDADGNGTVDSNDLPALASGLGGATLLPPGADVNCDGDFDAADLSALIRFLQQ